MQRVLEGVGTVGDVTKGGCHDADRTQDDGGLDAMFLLPANLLAMCCVISARICCSRTRDGRLQSLGSPAPAVLFVEDSNCECPRHCDALSSGVMVELTENVDNLACVAGFGAAGES